MYNGHRFNKAAKRARKAFAQRIHNRSLRFETLEARQLLAADVVFRVNAGGAALAGTPGWLADTSTSPSPYSNASAGNTGTTITTETVSTTNPSLPAGTPMALFQSDRFDKAGLPNMEWNFPVTPGNYEVRLYFAETWSGAFSAGVRKFDVSIEGVKVLNDYDIFADVGALTGVMKSFVVATDSNVDIDFGREVQNPIVKGIEILRVAPALQASATSLNFGNVTVGQTGTQQLTLTNGGQSGDPSITINPTATTIAPSGSPFSFTYSQQTLITLAPGQSTIVSVKYTPTSGTSNSATLQIPNSGPNSPLNVSLTGTGVTTTAISFGKSTLNAATGLSQPTSLQFGPDGRLYVAQQNGLINAYTIARTGTNSYNVASTEFITLVQQIPNHDDNGTLNPTVNTRLVTGLVVTGTAQNPVLYVASSDPRIGGGSSGTDTNLDTNSGIISKLTWSGTAWQKLDLVRGLPRSEENHAANGLQFNPATNTLFLAIGGNTNMGAPSNNFALLPEDALSAAILSINLTAIGNTTYDLPTLDDENRTGTADANDPFGGDNGKNQAKLVPGGPVQVYAPGFRNPYDVVITSNGRMYTVDNGPNAGWGDVPILDSNGNATNQVHEPGLSEEDSLHFITGAGYYGGHPNPTRAFTGNTFNTTNPQSPVSVGNPIESNFLAPGPANHALALFGDSTNGIAEYTSTNFGGAMQGDLLIASFDNTIKRIKLSADGTQAISNTNLFSSVGLKPLDVTSPSTGPFAGSIWVADIALGTIVVFEPAAAGGGNPNDLDGDGYSNSDETANGTDPNSAADVPPDWDHDFTSNLNDPNDDNDSLPDTSDPFAVDAANGSTTPTATFYDWKNSSQSLGGIFDMGFTGLMTNGVSNYEALYNPQGVTAGGAASVFTIDTATAGTAFGSANTQQQAFQFGVNVANQTTPFTAKSTVLGPFSGVTPQAGQQMGFYIGTGDQDNFVELVLTGDNGGSVKAIREVNGVDTIIATQLLALPGPGAVNLWLVVDPVTKTVQPRYSVDGVNFISLGSATTIPASWLSGTLAVGLISTNPAGTGLPVTWGSLGVESAVVGDPKAYFSVAGQGGTLLTSSTFFPDSFHVKNLSTGNVRIQSVRMDARTALLHDVIFDPFGDGGNDVSKPFTPDSGADLTGQVSYAYLNPHDGGGFDGLEINFNDFDPGEEFTFSIDTEPTDQKGSVAPGPSSSGKISGMELTGSIITIVYSDGTTSQARTFRTPGSGSASQVTVEAGLPPAPGLSVLGSVVPPAVVTSAAQKLHVTGPVGASVRLLQVEAGLYLDGVPGGGFDVDPFEANKAIKLVEKTVTIGSSGFVDVPVTLTKSDPNAGYNHFIATIQDSAGLTGGLSQEIILKLEDPVVVSGAALRLNAYPNGVLNTSSTETAGSFQLTNQSTKGEKLSSVTINLSGSLLHDVVFDPNGTAGDTVGKTFTADAGSAATGLAGFSYGGPHDGGFDTLTINFNDFNPGETFTFSIDVDPTSIKGATTPGPQQSGNISGLEASGATITANFSDGTTRVADLFAVSGSNVNSQVIVNNTVLPTPSIAMIGVSSTPAIVTSASQTIRITAPAGSTARLLQTENALFLGGVPNGGFDIDSFETNKVIVVKHTTVVVGSAGFVDVPVVLSDTNVRGGVNQFMAVIQQSDGQTSRVSNMIVVALNDVPTAATALVAPSVAVAPTKSAPKSPSSNKKSSGNQSATTSSTIDLLMAPVSSAPGNVKQEAQGQSHHHDKSVKNQKPSSKSVLKNV